MPHEAVFRSITAEADHETRPTLVLLWGTRSVALRLDLWKGVLLAIVLPTLAAFYLGATVYFVWHDRLLAALMLRQVDMQYAYEDRIAALKSQSIRDADQAATDRTGFENGLRDLTERSERLESHAAIIDGVVAHLHPDTGASPLPPSSSANRADAVPTSPAPETMRTLTLGRLDKPDNDDGMSRADALAHAYDRLDDRQKAMLGALAGPTVKSVERLHRVLARTGLPLDRWHVSRDMGGPFVPLSNGMQSFEQTAALIDNATVRRAELIKILSGIPVRRPFARPLDVTSSFGARLDPFYGRPAMHTGVDLHENYGEIVAATAGGIITLAGVDGGYGKMVEIDHGHGVRTRYAHLESIAVSVGQNIAVGAPVGQVGASGRATGPHLHYEVRIDGEPVDPMRFLKAGEDLPQPG